MGAVRVARAFIPGMVQAGGGRVVLTGSEDALQPYADELPYCAARIHRHANDRCHDGEALERKESILRCGIDSFLDEERPTIELHRRGEADEVAATMVYLCSKQASFINGANVRVDGGSVASL